jgi:hypothetical protein
MKYFVLNDNLYAYDDAAGIEIQFDKTTGTWKLSDKTYGELITAENASEISKKSAMELSSNKTPDKFIEDFVQKYSPEK